MEKFDWIGDLDAELERGDFHSLTEVACHFEVFLDSKEGQSLLPVTFTLKEEIVELIAGKLPKLSSRLPPVLQINVKVL